MVDEFVDFLRMASLKELNSLYDTHGLTLIIEDGCITGYEYIE